MRPFALIPVVAQAGAERASPAGIADGWRALLGEPAFVELVVVLAAVLVLAWLWRRVALGLQAFRGRSGLRSYLLGVELAAAGHPDAARRRLQKVLAEDPENHHARLLLGEVLAELGATGEAHKHHLFLQRAFGVRSVRNDLALSRLLLEVGRASEAVDAARRAVEHLEAPRTLLALWTAQRAAGLPENAGRTGLRLLRLLPMGDGRAKVQDDTTGSLALAGTVKLRAGDLEAARALSAEADALAPEHADAVRLRGQIAVATRGVAAAVEWMAGLPVRSADERDDERIAAVVGGLAALVPSAPYRCTACGASRARAGLVCEVCGARAPALAREPALFEPLESASAAMDEVEANRAHVQRQIQRAAEGDEAAVEDLVSIGEPAVEEVLLAASRRPEGADVFVRLMHRMGPRVLPALFRAYAALKDRTAHGASDDVRPEREAGVLGRVVQGYGRDALPWFQQLLGSDDRDVRKVLLDFYLGLGEADELAHVLEYVPPIELLHRLNAAPDDVVVDLLRSAERGGVLAEGLLLEPAFCRERELLRAVAGANDPDALLSVLERRGPNAALVELVLRHLEQPSLAVTAGRLLDTFGVAALEQMVAAFADLDRPAAVRAELRRRLTALGAQIVAPACRLFGAAPAALDGDVIALLSSLGDDAVAPLLAAYAEPAPIERRLPQRSSHRRLCVVRVLAELRASDALRRLRDQETDPILEPRIQQALYALAGDSDPVRAHREERRGQTS